MRRGLKNESNPYGIIKTVNKSFPHCFHSVVETKWQRPASDTSFGTGSDCAERSITSGLISFFYECNGDSHVEMSNLESGSEVIHLPLTLVNLNNSKRKRSAPRNVPCRALYGHVRPFPKISHQLAWCS